MTTAQFSSLRPPPGKDPFVDFAAGVLNNLFNARKRLSRVAGTEAAERSLDLIEEAFSAVPVGAAGKCVAFIMHDPTGEPYAPTRADLQASLAGESSEKMRVCETMKPIISLRTTIDGMATSIIVQQGVVVVRGAQQ